MVGCGMVLEQANAMEREMKRIDSGAEAQLGGERWKEKPRGSLELHWFI